MKTNIIIIGLIAVILIPSVVFAIEKATRISDREIVERLTRLETKIDTIDKRFDDINKQFERIDSQFNRLTNIMLGILGAFTALLGGTIWFALWDRRTMIRPFEDKVKKIDDDIAENRNKLNTLIDSLRSLSKTDEKVAEVLKKFNLL
jgi:DNA anti-recombination protein RmuC